LFPCYSVNNNQMEFHTFDPTQGFNDPNASSEYHWRVEQIAPYRQATIRRLVLTYRDFGEIFATFTITGVNDAQKEISTSQGLGFGNATPTGRLMTVPVDILLTGMNLQVSVEREKGAGPLSIAQLVVVGEVEETQL
jgi:hypothetical protein